MRDDEYSGRMSYAQLLKSSATLIMTIVLDTVHRLHNLDTNRICLRHQAQGLTETPCRVSRTPAMFIVTPLPQTDIKFIKCYPMTQNIATV
jgi:hypothetical protein